MAQTFKPKRPYIIGGYNQVSARRAVGTCRKQHQIKPEKAVPRRIEKKAISHYDAHGTARMQKLPRAARRMMMQWAEYEMKSVQSVLLGYVD